MRYRIFGRNTGLRVSELALGTGGFGTKWGYGSEPDEARRIFAGFVEAGGNFIDTADGYQFGQAEELVGELIASDRDRFVLATKYTIGANPKGGVSRSGNSRKNMVRSVEESLRRLRTDRIDLYWVHMDDGLTPIAEIVQGLNDLVRAGKVLYVGFSDFPAWRIAAAATLAEVRGWAPIAGVQLEYSLAERTPDRELLPMAEAMGLGVALWSPLGGGLLSGKYRKGEEGRLTTWGRLVHQEDSAQKAAILDTVLDVAKETGATAAQVAIAWLRHEADRSTTALIPVLGPRTRAQLDDTLAALEVKLTDEQARRLTEASAVPLGFPHEFFVKNTSSGVLTGGEDYGRIQRPRVPVA